MTFRYSRSGRKLTKQDVRRDLEPALCDIEDQFGTSVATFADLPSPLPFIDGTSAYVVSRKAFYRTFGGVWSRVHEPNSSWQVETDWYLDPVSGSDDASGRAGFPIQTCQELYERLCGGSTWTCNQVTKIHILRDVPLSDPLTLDFRCTANGQVQVYGEGTTTLASGTTTAVTAQNRASGSGVPSAITDTTQTWAPYVGARIRTTGTTPRMGWISKDLTSNQVRISNFKAVMTLSQVIPGTSIIAPPSAPAVGDPTSGDGYVVEQLTRIDAMRINCQPGYSAGNSAIPIVFKDLDCGGTVLSASFISCISTGSLILFAQCFYGVQPNSTQVFAYNSKVPLFALRAGSLTLVGGLTLGTVSVRNGGRLTVDGDFMVQGGQVAANEGGVLKLSACCGFDAPASAYNIDVDASPARTAVSSYSSDLVWGSGNVYGIRCGSKLTYVTKPTITGTTADANVGGTAKALAALPFVEPANGSAIVANFT